MKALGRKLAGEQLDRTSALREPSPPATPNTSRVVAFREEASCQVEPGPRDQPRQWRAPIDARRQVSAALPFKRELPHARDRCGERNEVKWGFACCGIRWPVLTSPRKSRWGKYPRTSIARGSRVQAGCRRYRYRMSRRHGSPPGGFSASSRRC